jgi:hypothetical protein
LQAPGCQVANRRGGEGEYVEKQKKILNRRNELKDLLKIKELASFGEKTNWFLSAKEAHQSENRGLKSAIC